MYEKTLKKPLEFRSKGSTSEDAVDILQKVPRKRTFQFTML